MSDWKDSISQVVGTERINDINQYISTCSADDVSPIDQFYAEAQSILSLFPQEAWEGNGWVGPLSSIAVVSNVENYFRQVFSKILKVCVDSQKTSASNNINLGSVIWHSTNEIERGAFEHISLASSENINNTAKKFVGVDLKSKGLKAILEEFDKVCELRHGIVHSGRVLAGKNGIKLKLPASNDITQIDIGFAEFQELMSVCNALVVSSNKIFFSEIVTRWATSWRNTASWDNKTASAKFKIIWKIFYSNKDGQNGTIPKKLTWIKCRNQVIQEFNI